MRTRGPHTFLFLDFPQTSAFQTFLRAFLRKAGSWQPVCTSTSATHPNKRCCAWWATTAIHPTLSSSASNICNVAHAFDLLHHRIPEPRLCLTLSWASLRTWWKAMCSSSEQWRALHFRSLDLWIVQLDFMLPKPLNPRIHPRSLKQSWTYGCDRLDFPRGWSLTLTHHSGVIARLDLSLLALKCTTAQLKHTGSLAQLSVETVS